MQKPRPTDTTGVTVSIDAIDSNNNFVHLGGATSDASGLYSLAWATPDVPGEIHYHRNFLWLQCLLAIIL
jgi:hypothetical protein